MAHPGNEAPPPVERGSDALLTFALKCPGIRPDRTRASVPRRSIRLDLVAAVITFLSVRVSDQRLTDERHPTRPRQI